MAAGCVLQRVHGMIKARTRHSLLDSGSQIQEESHQFLPRQRSGGGEREQPDRLQGGAL
jgi:hypothetical protein